MMEEIAEIFQVHSTFEKNYLSQLNNRTTFKVLVIKFWKASLWVSFSIQFYYTFILFRYSNAHFS